jgi:hypothetical protein
LINLPTILQKRPLAKFLHHAVAQSFRIALAGFGERNDLLGDYFVGKVIAIGKSKRYQGHFESEAHDPDRLAFGQT